MSVTVDAGEAELVAVVSDRVNGAVPGPLAQTGGGYGLQGMRERARALGYLTKDAGIAEISRAVQAAAAGHSLLDAAVQGRLLAAAARGAEPPATAPAAPLPDDLTPREAEVLGLMPAACPTPRSLMRWSSRRPPSRPTSTTCSAKIGDRDRAQAVHYAYTHGLAGG
jgi:hypothetical protein